MNRIYALALLTGTLAGGAVFPISDASAASFPETRLEAVASGIGIDLIQFRPPGDDDDEGRRRRRRDGDDDGADRDRGRDDNADDDDGDRERRRGRGRDDDDDDRDRDRRRDRDDYDDRGRRDRDRDRWRGRRWGGPPPPWALRQCFPRRPVWTPWGWRCRGYRPDY